jgi:hypothetical protein
MNSNIADCQLPIADLQLGHKSVVGPEVKSAIGNWQLEL